MLFQGKVLVALPGESGEPILSWVLEHASSSAEIIIVHVRQKKRGASENRVEHYEGCVGLKAEHGRIQEQDKDPAAKELVQSQHTYLEKYLDQCAKLKVKAETLVHDEWDIAEGILELVDRFWIRTLVMGAGSHQHYSKELTVPQSKKAMKLMEYGHPFCKIWFVCDRNLIFIRNPVEDLRSVPVFVDADDDVFNIENSIDHVLRNVDETHEQGIQAILEELRDAMVHRQKEKVSIGNKEFAELDEQSKQLMIELDSALAKVKFLEEQKKQLMTEWNFSIKEIVELRKQRRTLETERDSALIEMKRFHEKADQAMTEIQELKAKLNYTKMLIEQEKLGRKVEVLRKEKHEATTKLDHAVLEAMDARRQNILMMAERDRALQATKTRGLQAQLEQVTSEMPHPYMMPCSHFTPEELRNATLRFSDGLKVGQGGFGVVYKGFLCNTTVAVKMLSSTGVQGQSEFKQEVTILSTVRHPNIVTLVGACQEALALVYEFMPNGSLEDYLEHTARAPSLSWQLRTRIIAELCSALSFLHKNKPYAVVHGDVKPANILLDGNMVAKLCDFGTSRCLIQSGEGSVDSAMLCTSHPWGTLGYMDPEFHTTGVLTPWSDTYSFGVTVLRILTARSPLNIARVVRDALERGDLRSVVDASAGDWPIDQARRLVDLALRCTEMTSDKRPDMASEVWSIVKRLADEASGEALGVGSSRPHFGIAQQLGVGMESPVYPCKCLSGMIKIHGVAEASKR